MIRTAVVVSDDSKEDEAGINNTVTVYIEEDDMEESFKLVTTMQWKFRLKGLISIESPMGKAVLGHKVGDRVSVKVNDDYSYDVIIRKIENTGEENEKTEASKR